MNTYRLHTKWRGVMYAGMTGCGIALHAALVDQNPALLAGAVVLGLGISAGVGYLDHIALRAYSAAVGSLAGLIAQVQKRGYTVKDTADGWELKG